MSNNIFIASNCINSFTRFHRSDIDYKMLLDQSAFFNYCRFVIRDNYLQVEAVASLTGISEETIKEMVQEVANLADQFEMKLTGADIY